jgi:hypothetical protein
VLELEDLAGLCLVIRPDANDKLRVFVWKAPDWEDSSEVEGTFLDEVLDLNYSEYNPEHI